MYTHAIWAPDDNEELGRTVRERVDTSRRYIFKQSSHFYAMEKSNEVLFISWTNFRFSSIHTNFLLLKDFTQHVIFTVFFYSARYSLII